MPRMAGRLACTHTFFKLEGKHANFVSSLIAKPREDLLFLFGG